jgi:hypothetical protein
MNRLFKYILMAFIFSSCGYSVNEISKSSISSSNNFLCYEDGQFNQMPFDLKGCNSPNSTRPIGSNVRDIKVKDGALYVLTDRGLSISQNGGQTWTNRGRKTIGLGLAGTGDYYESAELVPQARLLSFDLAGNIFFHSIFQFGVYSYFTSSNNGESFALLPMNITTISIENARAQIESIPVGDGLDYNFADGNSGYIADSMNNIPVGTIIQGSPYYSYFYKDGDTIIGVYSLEVANTEDLGKMTLLIKSIDNGATFTVTELARILGPLETGLEAFHGQNDHVFFTSDLKIVVREVDIANKVFISDVNQDNFQEFSSVNLPVQNMDVNSMIIHGNNLIYFNNGTLFQLDTQTMVESTLFTDPALSGIVITTLYAHGDVFYLGHTRGLFKIENNQQVELISDIAYPSNIQVVATGSNKLYLGTKDGLYISGDLGQTFLKKTTLDGLGSNFINSILVQNEKLYVATTNGLSISSDGGESFINHENAATANEKNINAILISEDKVFISSKMGAFVSMIDAISFTKLNFATNGLPEAASINSMIKNQGKLYFATSGNTADISRRGLFVSSDNGLSFVRDTGIDINLYSVFIDSSETSYVAGTSGLSFKRTHDLVWNAVSASDVHSGLFRVKAFYEASGGDVFVSGFNGLAVTQNSGVSYQTVLRRIGGASVAELSSVTTLGDYFFVAVRGELFVSKNYFQ